MHAVFANTTTSRGRKVDGRNLYGIIEDLFLLSAVDLFVGTFSSNVASLTYQVVYSNGSFVWEVNTL